MKIAISIPDSLYEEAERLAESLHLSRSALYARALEYIVRQHGAAHVTAALNRVYATEQPGEHDDFVNAAAAHTLRNEYW